MILSLTVLICLFAGWVFAHGYTLYWGDAQAHLYNSRGIFDARSPGFENLGTVWLPALHVLTLPFVQNDWLWRSGLAGTIPAAACFVLAGTCFYLAARDTFEAALSAVVALLCFALNPNVLYLSAIPMTESVFLAGLAVAFLALLRFARTQNRRYLLLAIGASWFMSLSRYDGWFLIPFVGLWAARAAERRRLPTFFAVAGAASLVPLAWLAHCWWQTSNALDFANGPYSAAAIQGGKPYPGWHNWPQAIAYYFAAGQLCAGWPLLLLGAAGGVIAAFQARMRAAFFLFLTPAFYVWSMHSSANPIHIPTLSPFSYYNTRYGIAVVVFCAFAAGALAEMLAVRGRYFACALPLLAISPWLVRPSPEHWICWKESAQNSLSRRAWTAAAAGYFRKHYQAGDGVLLHFGDLAGILREADLPLREAIHEGTKPDWLPAIGAPCAFHPAKWAIAQRGDVVSTALAKCRPAAYDLVFAMPTKDAPVLEIYQRIQ